MVTPGADGAVVEAPVSRVDRKREAEALDYARGRQRDMALKLLMVIYGDLIAGFISRLVSDPGRTKQIYQAVFLRAFHGIHRFRFGKHASVWAWLCQVTWETLVEEEQPRAPHGPDVASGASQEPGASVAPHVVKGGSASPDSLMDADRTPLERCLMELPCHLRAQLLMRFSLGLSDTEIGTVMGIDAGTVALNVSQIQSWLRRCMGRRGEGT